MVFLLSNMFSYFYFRKQKVILEKVTKQNQVFDKFMK